MKGAISYQLSAVSYQQRKSNECQIAPRLLYPVYLVGGANPT
jgi:hypothetical protein